MSTSKSPRVHIFRGLRPADSMKPIFSWWVFRSAQMLKNLFTIFSLFSSNQAFCAEAIDIEEVDFNGTAMVSRFGTRIIDSSINEVCDKLKKKKYKNVRFLNLSKNYISDLGAQKLAHFFSKEYLPCLEVLDLSFNKITDQGMMYFTPLLRRSNFEYIIIYGNNGAATTEGIKNLASVITDDLKIIDHEEIRKYLGKVIWVSESCLDTVKKRGDIPEYYAQVHSTYYNRPTIDYSEKSYYELLEKLEKNCTKKKIVTMAGYSQGNDSRNLKKMKDPNYSDKMFRWRKIIDALKKDDDLSYLLYTENSEKDLLSSFNAILSFGSDE